MSTSLRKKKRTDVLSPESFLEDEQIEVPLFSLATLGLQPVGTAPPPKPQPQYPKQALNARGRPARIRKRNRFFFDDNIINDDKPLRVSLSPRKTPSKPSTAIAQQQTGQYSPKTPSKLLKSQKSIMKNDGKQKSEGSNYESRSASKMQLVNKNKLNNTNDEIRKVTIRLRNTLKLPKPHLWVTNEFFTSFIDQPLLEGENDFQLFLEQINPDLHDRDLTRCEWICLRSMMGKPRRCSARFFTEERRSLEKKRQKVRFVQANRSGEYKDANFLADLPDKIPLPLPLGTKVQARLYGYLQNGVQYGTVDAFNSQSSTYRVQFEKVTTGKHTIHDCDIRSESFFEMLHLQSIFKDYRPLQPYITGQTVSSPIRMDMRGLRSALTMNLNKSDPLLGQEVYDSPYNNPVLLHDNIKGRPMALLEHVVRLRHALDNKKSKLQRLCDMNNEAESSMPTVMLNNAASNASNNLNTSNCSSDESVGNAELTMNPNCHLSEDFQRRYASIVISMERVNRDIQDYLYEVQGLATEVTRDPMEQAMLAPTYLREKCREEAEWHITTYNHGRVKNKATLNLISNLTTIVVLASHLGSNDSNNAQVSKTLDVCMEEAKNDLFNVNVDTFQKNVQLHMHHIRLGIGQNALSSSNQ